MRKQDKNNETFIKKTSIPGLLIIERPTFKDDRGFFREPFRLNELEDALDYRFSFKQMNHSLSKPGVIRGVHAENWNKVVYPVTGEVFLALADIRPDSKTFGKVVTFEYDAGKEHRVIFIPKGVANSICVVGREAVNYIYLVDAYYNGKDTTAVAWDDPDLAIPWPVKSPIISERDRGNPRLRDLFPEKFKNK